MKLKTIPKVIAVELLAALRATDRFGEMRYFWLKRYRQNQVKRIATWGISNIGASVEGLEVIPIEYLEDIKRLDDVFRTLHHFLNGGAGDYAAKSVERVINQYRASGPRKAKNEQQKEILKFLMNRDYPNQENQKAIRIAASELFGISERTVSRAIEKGGIAKQRNKL